MMGMLLENLKVVPAFVPINSTGAGQDGDWVNLKNFRRCLILIQKGAWAGGTPAVTVEQAKDASGTDGKALSFTKQYSGTALTADTLTENTVTSNTFNLSATANEFHLIEFHAQDLDIANGFTHLRLRVATPGANADLISATYILGDPRVAAGPTVLPTVIT